MIHPRIASRLFNAPLMVHPQKAVAILHGIGYRVTGADCQTDTPALHHVAFEGGRPSMGVLGDNLGKSIERRGQSVLQIHRGVAIIPIEGSLVHKGGWLGSSSGETSYQGIQTQVVRAAKDPAVKGVVFEVDSFGGEVSGAFEIADLMFELSAMKPTLSILTDHAYSAGYLLASTARAVVIPERGGAGSIGVITMHTDMSKALEMQGVNVTILSAGKHKADGNPFEALPETVAARIQANLEQSREAFAGHVSRYRGARLTFEKAMATEALDYTGADAVAAGLADVVGPGLQAFENFVAQLNRP
jgi:capsid assembly protease